MPKNGPKQIGIELCSCVVGRSGVTGFKSITGIVVKLSADKSKVRVATLGKTYELSVMDCRLRDVPDDLVNLRRRKINELGLRPDPV